MNKSISLKNFEDTFLKSILYSLPLLVILGSGMVNVALFFVTLIYFFNCIKKKEILFFKNYEFKFFLLLYIYLILNSLQSNEIQVSLIRTFGYVRFFIFVLVYKDFIEQKKINLKSLGFFWLIIITFLNLDIIYQSIFGSDIFGYNSGNHLRNSGFFFDELVAGGFLLSFTFISVFLFRGNNNNNNLFLYLFLVFCLVVVFLTGERASFIKFLLIFSIVSIFFIKGKLFIASNKKIFSLVAIFLLAVIYINGNMLKDRYFSSLSYSSKNNLSLIDKYLTSEYGSHTISAFFVFLENPLTGVGNKNFRFECKKQINQVHKIQKKIDLKLKNYSSGCSTHPHQIYNELLSEHGIIGSIIIILLIFKLMLKKFNLEKLSSLNIISFFYIIFWFLPILPSGSFFTTFNSTLIWINFLFYLINNSKDD